MDKKHYLCSVKESNIAITPKPYGITGQAEAHDELRNKNRENFQE